MKRVALYIRVSTQEQSIHGLSLEAQRASLDEWAQWGRVEVVGLYADPGVSAGCKRPLPSRWHRRTGRTGK